MGAAEERFPELAVDEVRTGRASASRGLSGALLCRSLASLAFAATQMRDGGAPDLQTLGCTLLPAGTALTLEQDGRSWVVRSQTLLGVPVRGVTEPEMIEIDKASP